MNSLATAEGGPLVQAGFINTRPTIQNVCFGERLVIKYLRSGGNIPLN